MSLFSILLAAGDAAGHAADTGHGAAEHAPGMYGAPVAHGEPSGLENFLEILTKPDNIPIVAMLFIVLYFFALSMKMGMENDRLTAKGEKEKIYDRMNRWVWGESEEGES